MTQPPTLSNWLSILVLGVIWGGTFMVVAVALKGYGPITVAAARTGLGALAVLGLMLALRRPWPREGKVWAYALPIGVLSAALPFFLLSWGQQHVPSAFAGLSMSALPLFVLPLAHFFSDEPLDPRRAAGVTLGFVGALVLIGPDALRGIASGKLTGESGLGQLACLGAALSYAVASILTRRCPPVDGIALTTITLSIGAVILVPAMLLTEGVPVPTGRVPDLAILFLGLLPTALAALLRIQVIRSAGSVFMTLVNYQVPLWSMLFGALVLSEALPWRFFAALALILAGLMVSQAGAMRALLARRTG